MGIFRPEMPILYGLVGRFTKSLTGDYHVKTLAMIPALNNVFNMA